MEPSKLLLHAQRLQAIAQAGLAYATNAYDLERYEEIRAISVNLLQELTDEPHEKIIRTFASESGYQTPKVDVRAVLFRGEQEILLVKEKDDQGRWTLPGGWADVGYSPFEVAMKEAEEETGLRVRAVRLLALYDKRKHPHPPQPWYVYKGLVPGRAVVVSCVIDRPGDRIPTRDSFQICQRPEPARSMRLRTAGEGVVIMTAALLVAHAQSTCREALATIKATSTLVAAPTLVRLPSGEFVKHLSADQIELFDNGIRQKVTLEEAGNRPIALVVLMQTSGQDAGQFQNYRKLPELLDSMIGQSVHEIMLVTFDSRPRATWHFPARSDGVEYALAHPVAGDDGAAILDAVDYVIELLQQEAGDFRRIVLLLGQSQDEGSRTSAEELVRHLGKGNTSVYSLTFSAPKSPPHSWGKSRAAKPRAFSPGGQVDEVVDLSTPLGAAVKALQTNTADELAVLSGGAHLKFRDEPDFEKQLSTIADDIHHRYMLSFQPDSHQPGFHTLSVRVAGQQSHLGILARTSYWFEAGN
jgi:VWFA-related protein